MRYEIYSVGRKNLNRILCVFQSNSPHSSPECLTPIITLTIPRIAPAIVIHNLQLNASSKILAIDMIRYNQFATSFLSKFVIYINVSSTNYSTQYQRLRRTDVTISSKSPFILRVTPPKSSPIEGRTYPRIRFTNPLKEVVL